MTDTMGLSVRDWLGLGQLGDTPPDSMYAFTNGDGDQISVSSWANGTLVTECTNGTTTVHSPDGSSRSANDPFGGAPILVAIDPDGNRTTQMPNGKTEAVQPDGTTRVENPDGSAVTVHPDGQVELEVNGQPPATGMTLDEAIAQGHLTDVQLVSTGANLGPVAVLVGTCSGSLPFVLVPPSVLTPADAVTNQTLDTHPTVIDTGTPGPIEVEIPGACRNDPALPPAPSGDTGISLQSLPNGDPTAHIPDIVEGVVNSGAIPADLVGNAADTIQTLDQVTRWLRHDATPMALVGFLTPRIPGSQSEKQQKAQEITDWGARLVDKTRNLDKQVAGAPEAPPTIPVSDTPPAGTQTRERDKPADDEKDEEPAEDEKPEEKPPSWWQRLKHWAKRFLRIGGRTAKGRAGSTVDMKTVEEAVETVREAVQDAPYKIAMIHKLWEMNLAEGKPAKTADEQAWRDRRRREQAWDEWREDPDSPDGLPDDLKDATPEQRQQFEEAHPDLPPAPQDLPWYKSWQE